MIKIDERLWRSRKEEFRRRLFEDLEIGYLDRDIKDVLLYFFNTSSYFTLSSCSGRITLVDSPMPWMRDRSSVIFKKHSPITTEEIEKVLKQTAVWGIWLVVTGPIIHVSARDVDSAFQLLAIAREAGMKHSGIISSSTKGIVIELTSGVYISLLLKLPHRIMVDKDKIPWIVSTANKVLIEGKKRLNKLREALGIRSLDYLRMWSTKTTET